MENRFPELETRLGITEPAARAILGAEWDRKYDPNCGGMPWGDNRDLLMLAAVAVRDGQKCGGCAENGFVCDVAATPEWTYWCETCFRNRQNGPHFNVFD